MTFLFFDLKVHFFFSPPLGVRVDGRTGIKSVLRFSLYFVRIQIMYISTCIRNKNCHQHSYGFKNLMSSWGSWSKISKLQQVGDVSFFRSKSSLFIFTTTWEAFFAKKYQFSNFLWLFIFIEDFIKDFTKDFIKGFT